MKGRTTHTRLARLEAQQAERARPWGRFIQLDLIDVPPDEAARRIAEAKAQKRPEDLLIIVQATLLLPTLEAA